MYSICNKIRVILSIKIPNISLFLVFLNPAGGTDLHIVPSPPHAAGIHVSEPISNDAPKLNVFVAT